jgi:hypothetical protein
MDRNVQTISALGESVFFPPMSHASTSLLGIDGWLTTPGETPRLAVSPGEFYPSSRSMAHPQR